MILRQTHALVRCLFCFQLYPFVMDFFVFTIYPLTWSSLQVIHYFGGVFMKIAEVSERYSISSDTLRYYERTGLIRPVN